ncbi:hypothetical protein GW17_00022928 [Ensete ventricosum]|uniref:Uncharacterized protein n=1 Tax=Ensete ventricosum TaxID=4639 RepID=A0A426ZLZ7_ENSVE|nr:hypothetical protein B296_00041391 [Ensete ventricosum]RWW13348.1 hypothetical protein GW17_00022928 [Ensete ventricosum]
MRIQWKPIKRTKLQSTGTVGVQRSPPTVARDREKKRKERMRGRNRSPSSGDWVAEPGGGRQLRRRERESALRHRSGRGTEHDRGQSYDEASFLSFIALFTFVFYVERSNKAWDLGGSRAQGSVLCSPTTTLAFWLK